METISKHDDRQIKKGAQLMDTKLLRSILSYDPLTGDFHWLIRPSARTMIGDLAGSDDGQGYIAIGYKGVRYFAHILAVLHMTGDWPKHEVDHKDTVKSNNRWSNLRDRPHIVNQHNHQALQVNNTSGVTGVTWDRTNQKWLAQIKVGGKRITLGRFVEFDDAKAARAAGKAEHHYDLTA